jgi:DNA-binding beta-propeller fold protein YncE
LGAKIERKESLKMMYGAGKHQYSLVDGWAKLSEGESFRDVTGIAVNKQDQVVVLNRSQHPIMVFDHEGNLVSSWGEGYFGRAHGSCIGPDGSIYCTDDRKHIVTEFDSKGKVLMVLGTKDKPSDTGYRPTSDFFESLATITHGGPPFNRPTGVDISPSGDIFVADGYGNARVHRFSADGQLLFSWGEPGPAPGQFRLPHSLRVDRCERVWVADRENSRIQIFNDKGEFLTQWTDLFRPTDLCIANDVVYVSELCRRISIFTMEGKLLARWGNEGHDPGDPLFVAPHAVAVDSHGDLYIGEVAVTSAKVDRGARTIQKFAHRSE